ncbi:aldehyde ferredoxin oxidoreductase family protein [Chloroflexota bacterium]
MFETNVLQIDLSSRSYVVKQIPKEIIKKYIGGRGLGSYLVYKAVPPKADPLGTENHLIFTAGAASGTDMFFSSKVNLSTKSPLTGGYLSTVASTTLGHQMAKAGYYAIDIKGIAKSPTFLVITKDGVEFKDGATVWGMETARAQTEMLGDLSPKAAATVAIGPTGEKQVLYAAIFTEGGNYRCWGRAGSGAVMGTKMLKGIVVQGDNEIEIPDMEKYRAVKLEMVEALKTKGKKWADRWSRYETGSDLELMDKAGLIPTKNWQYGQFAKWRGIDKSTTPIGWPEEKHACAPYCPNPGCRFTEVTEGPYKGARADVEWEAIYSFGSQCGIDKMEAVIAATQICDETGLDIMSAGITVGFAMECFEKGLITGADTDGVELRFGNDEAMITMINKIADQEGFGKRLGLGVKRLAEQIPGSEGFAIHAKGLELGGYECRGYNGQALQFAINPSGGNHHSYGLPARVEMNDGSGMSTEGKGLMVRKQAMGQIIRDSLTVCSFPKVALDYSVMTGILQAVTGETWTDAELDEAAERTMCQERLFNIREGMTRKDDALPERLLSEPKPDGLNPGATVPLEVLKDDYYQVMGYDLATGNPPDELIAKLGVLK